MTYHLFPLEFQKVLISKETDYANLSKRMARKGFRLSKQFIGQIALGQRPPPPLQLRRICDTLELDSMARQMLSRAACLDQGYEI